MDLLSATVPENAAAEEPTRGRRESGLTKLDLDSLYQMPTPQQQQQLWQHTAFITQGQRVAMVLPSPPVVRETFEYKVSDLDSVDHLPDRKKLRRRRRRADRHLRSPHIRQCPPQDRPGTRTAATPSTAPSAPTRSLTPTSEPPRKPVPPPTTRFSWTHREPKTMTPVDVACTCVD